MFPDIVFPKTKIPVIVLLRCQSGADAGKRRILLQFLSIWMVIQRFYEILILKIAAF